MSKDTIYREDAIKAINARSDWYQVTCNGKQIAVMLMAKDVNEILEKLPSADRPQGKWLLKDNVFHCGCCGKESHFTADDVYVYDMPLPDFCEKCGARLKGADDD